MAQSFVDRLSEPLKTVRDLTLRRINEIINALFENTDDALFSLAEHAKGDAAYTEFFDDMRDVRKKRQHVERATLERISQIFDEFAFARLAPPKTTAVAPNADVGLSLVDDDELEEALAVSGMIAKTESRLGHHLYALNRRLSAIRGVPVENTTNPIGPAQLCAAFQLALSVFDLHLASKLIVFKLLDRYLMSGLDLLYEGVNAHLIHAGVLPQLRLRGGHTAPPASAAPAPAGASVQYPSNYAGEAAAGAQTPIETEIYQTLRSLLALRHQGSAASGPAPMMPAEGAQPAGVPLLAPTDLLSALQILQSQSMMSQNYGGEALVHARQLKQALLDQADQLQAGSHARVSAVDEDTIDLVGMLFEFIVQDRDIPVQIQALLARLQIPYLKIALLDRHLFTHKTHSARLLLDNMALACVGKSNDSQADQPLYEKIRDAVETILREFDDDLALIERTNTDFNAFVAATKRRAELTEKRTAEAVRGREKLDYARQLAAREMHQRCDGKQLPALFHTLLVGPWAQNLVLIALRQGETSAEWKQALNFADAFAWSATPKFSEEDRQRLRDLLPGMYDYLRKGLATVAYQGDDVQRLLRELNTFHQSLIDVAPRTAARTGGAANDPAVAEIVGMMEKNALRCEPEASPEAEDVDPACIKQIRAMKVGDWVEFGRAGSDAQQRAKLSWISPISHKYLFVDRKGLKVVDKTIAALAAELGDGSLTLHKDDPPLFDRALGAIVKRLKSAQDTGAGLAHAT
ncbi:MAG TPA: DUF1631 domain-containing protein [Rudaea sp.]